jgi:hypothetical protein
MTAHAFPSFLHQHDVLRIKHGQRPQQYRVNNAENGGIGPDANGQREHRHSGENWHLEQQAQAVTDILNKRMHSSLHHFPLQMERRTEMA